jgi:hypothetical protein
VDAKEQYQVKGSVLIDFGAGKPAWGSDLALKYRNKAARASVAAALSPYLQEGKVGYAATLKPGYWVELPQKQELDFSAKVKLKDPAGGREEVYAGVGVDYVVSMLSIGVAAEAPVRDVRSGIVGASIAVEYERAMRR